MNKIVLILIGIAAGYALRSATNNETKNNKAYFLSGVQFACIKMQNEQMKGNNPTINDILRSAYNFYEHHDYITSQEMQSNGWFPPVKGF